MKPFPRALAAISLVVVFSAFASDQTPTVDWNTVARIREEGLQRSQVMDIAGYIVDVLGARLTNSEDMKRAQAWVKGKMDELGLENVVIEPFMDYGVTWDNEFFSLHMLEPDYQPMTGFPLTHTPGTQGKVACPVVIAELQTKADLAKFKGKLKGVVVLASPPLAISQASLAAGVARLTDEDLKKLQENVVPPPARPTPPPPNPDLLKSDEKIAFFKAEGAVAVLQCEGGRPGVVVGFARPGTKDDKWSREESLGSLPIVAVTPEHYNRMCRILKRGLAVKIEIEIRNRLGDKVEKAANVLGEIPGPTSRARS